MAETHSRKELAVERDWLRARVRDIGTINFGRSTSGGPAANAMVEYALGGDFPAENDFPKSADDLLACQITRDTAPAHLHDAMDEVILKYKSHPLEPGMRQSKSGVTIPDFVSSLERDTFTIKLNALLSGSYTSEDHLLTEHQFLRERARLCGGFMTTVGADRCWGTSSNALVEYVLGGPEPYLRDYPHDDSDLTACERVVALLPAHLQKRGMSQLERYYSLSPDASRGGIGL
jgi:hypothetical protein